MVIREELILAAENENEYDKNDDVMINDGFVIEHITFLSPSVKSKCIYRCNWQCTGTHMHERCQVAQWCPAFLQHQEVTSIMV